MLINGRYLLLEPVGQGGMGRVWRCRDQVLDREVAVKEVVLPPGLSGEERVSLLTRVMREARATARIEHPSVITIYDVLEHEGVPWIVMRFVPGPSLRDEIKRAGRLPWQRVAEIGEQVADALAHAHAAGIVHRDLKPDNILLAGKRAIVTDFGIAHVANSTTKLTSTGVMMGTPHYMPPEQFDDRPVGSPTDMWALGATLYEAVEGRLPFEGATLSATVGAVLTKAPGDPVQAGPLRNVIGSLLDKDMAGRPDAATVARTLAALCIATAAVQAPAAASVPRPAIPPATDPPRPSVPAVPPAQAASLKTGTVGVRPVVPPKRKARTLAMAIGAAAVLATAAIVLPMALGGHPVAPRGHPGITASLEATLTDPGSKGVTTLAFSPNGGALATADKNGNVYLWNTATRQPIATLAGGGQQPIDMVAYSPDGTTVADGDYGGTLYLWKTSATGQFQATFSVPVSGGVHWSIDSVAFSPDGGTLATGAWNGNTYLLNPATAQPAATLAAPDGKGIYDIRYSPDGRTLAATETNGSTRLWNVATRQVAATIADPNSKDVYSVGYSPSGKTLVTADADGYAYLWNVATGQLIRTLSRPNGPAGTALYSAAFSPDGALLATGDYDGTIYLWNTATWGLIATLHDPGSTGAYVAFAPDGKTLADAGLDGRAYLWNITE